MEEGPPFNLRIELHQFESFFVDGRRKSVPRNPLAMWNLYDTVTIWWLLLLLLLVTDLFNNGSRGCKRKSVAITELNIYFNANWLHIYSQISQIIMSSSAGM